MSLAGSCFSSESAPRPFLEAVTKDLVFTISLKHSTQNLQLSTNWAGRLHHLLGEKQTSLFHLICEWPLLAQSGRSYANSIP
jgi:hypothetical protein